MDALAVLNDPKNVGTDGYVDPKVYDEIRDLGIATIGLDKSEFDSNFANHLRQGEWKGVDKYGNPFERVHVATTPSDTTTEQNEYDAKGKLIKKTTTKN